MMKSQQLFCKIL